MSNLIVQCDYISTRKLEVWVAKNPLHFKHKSGAIVCLHIGIGSLHAAPSSQVQFVFLWDILGILASLSRAMS